MNAIIRHLTSGQHFLATIDDNGNATACSTVLDDFDPRNYCPTDFEGYELQPWDDQADQWTNDMFVIVHEFEVV